MSLKVWLPLNGDLQNQGLTLLPNTSVNTFTYTSGKIGQCATGRVAWHLNEEILGNTWSVAMWIKPGSLGANNNVLFCKNNTSSTDCHIYFSIISTTQLNLGVNGPSSSVTATGQTFTTDTWYHVAATYDGAIATIYLNGRELKHGTVTTACPTGRLNININGRSTNAANTNTTGNITCSFNDFRLYDHCLSAAEVKEIAQGLVLHYKLDDITNGIVQDSSGYNNNGTITGIPVISTDTVRYSHSLYLETTNTNNHIDGGQLPSTIQTISFWHKNNSNVTSYVVFAEPSSGLMFGPAGNYAVVQVSTSSKTCYAITAPYYTNGDWNHIVVQKDGDNYKLWTNGVLRGSSGSNYYRHTGSNLWLFKRNYNNNYTTDSNISDFRAYTTLLSESDIKQLYEIGAKVDNKQNLHTYEFNENGSNKLTKTGILKDYAIEPYKTLSDGSYWKLMLFHYVNNGSNLFTSLNATYNNDFGLYSRLRDIANYTYDSKYEYYVIQDGKEFRWTQTSNPTASSIAGLTTVSGYTNPVNGLAKANQSNTYIGYGSWWGACGCWTKYSTGGKTGIPGFGSHDGNGICTNYLALYTRIEKPKAEIANENIYAENLIEF